MLTLKQYQDKFARYEALHLLACLYHNGQWSRGYRLLCRLAKRDFKPAFNAKPSLLSEQARMYYDRWLKIAKRTF